MRRFTIRRVLFALCFAAAMQAGTVAPKPDPELKKLVAIAGGHWIYEGEYKAGPLGPGGKMTGECTSQTILKGFFFENRCSEKGPWGEVRSRMIDAYDSANKNFMVNGYGDDGSRWTGTLTVSGNTIAYQGKIFTSDQQYPFRGSLVVAADRTSMTEQADISADGGKTWTPFFEQTYTRAAKPAPGEPAPKK